MVIKTRISIAMATYNGEKYLAQQLESFAKQTVLPDELIITDDCSSDTTIDIIGEFAAIAPFDVQWSVNESRLGYGGNFNAALMHTTGDLVFLSDQDDVWFPNKIELMCQYAQQNPDAMVLMNDMELTDSQLNPTGLTQIGQLESYGLDLNYGFVQGCCCLVKRHHLNLCLPIPPEFKAHDTWLVQISAAMGTRLVVKDILQFYRRHENNVTKSIVGGTKKINSISVLKAGVVNAFAAGARDKQIDSIRQQKILINKLQELEKDHQGMEAAIKLIQQKNETAELRLDVRGKWLLPRLYGVIRLYLLGGYKYTSGIKAVLKDVVGVG